MYNARRSKIPRISGERIWQDTQLFNAGIFTVWSLRSSLIVVFILSGSILTEELVDRLTYENNYPNPFAEYEAILPGEPLAALAPYHCTVNTPRDKGQVAADHIECVIFPDDGFFDVIHVEAQSNIIKELTFYATNLRLGDLLLQWKPTVYPNIKTVSLGWYVYTYPVEVYGWSADGYSIEVYGKGFQYDRQIRVFTVRRQ